MGGGGIPQVTGQRSGAGAPRERAEMAGKARLPGGDGEERPGPWGEGAEGEAQAPPRA